jgi:SAM-dependent methyltransferase
MTPDAARQWAESAGLRLRYNVDLPRLEELRTSFFQFGVDEGAARYIENAEATRHGRLVTWMHRALRFFLSDFDINGYLGTYPMHVLSTSQWRALLNDSGFGEQGGTRLLDVGAGRGDATSHLAQLFHETIVTETSSAMASRLRKQGYTCIQGDITERSNLDGNFDAVSLLNVLDRCDRPLSLLGKARTLLKPGGLLIIALVLPYGPFVYDGGQPRSPRERLPITSSDWESATSEFIRLALLPLGLELKAFTRAPYLSGGDAQKSIYELDDLVVVMKAGAEIPILEPSPSFPPAKPFPEFADEKK